VTAALLEVEDLRVRYGAVEAVHGVSFGANAGEVTALIGANGAGKSSTLAAISGLVPAGGRIRFDGHDIAGAAPHAIVRAGVVQVPEGREILARMTVEENLLMGLRDRDRSALGAAPFWLGACRAASSRCSRSRAPSSLGHVCSCSMSPHLASRR